MRYNKLWRIIILPLFIAAVAAAAVFSYRAEQNSCMGVPVIGEAEMSRFTAPAPEGTEMGILCDGEDAAVDTASSVVYISQNINGTTDYKDLVGRLEVSAPGWKMYFAEDEMLADLDGAVAENHPFRLIVSNGSGEYLEYSVVFTTLPVVRIEGEQLYTMPQTGTCFGGEFTVWDSNYAHTGGYIREKSSAEWLENDLRDSGEEKPTWKLSLKNPKGGINMLNLFGLGKDDDWILNGISGDALRVREKLAAHIWNSVSADGGYILKTPQGEYAEVVCNGEYKGIYTISRKTDQKFLDIDSDDLLLRDKKSPRGSYAQNNYTVLDGYYTEDEVWQIVEPFHKQEDLSVININSWIDANIIANAVYNKGRRDYTEMYYLFSNASSKPRVEFMPVTEDAVFGITHRTKRNIYELDESLCTAEVKYTDEYAKLKEIYPDLDERIGERYRYLRGDILSEKNIFDFTDSEYSTLTHSGALLREKVRWDISDKKQNSEELKEYIKARLEYLDTVYSVR